MLSTKSTSEFGPAIAGTARYLILDARYEKVREDGTQSQAVLLAIGITSIPTTSY